MWERSRELRGNAQLAAVANNPGNFKIEPAFIRVVEPAAGAVWTIGIAKTISWTSNLGVLETVDLRLSKDGGATYPISIVDGTEPPTTSEAFARDARSEPSFRRTGNEGRLTSLQAWCCSERSP
jgi:hypothetical protein